MANLQSLTVNDTGSLTLPSGTVANRTANGTPTVIQWTNTGTQAFSVLSGSTPSGLTSTNWTCPTGINYIEVLVVAGGGSGGNCYQNSGTPGGGGGAGGLIYNAVYPVTPGNSYTVTVGAGGAAQTTAQLAGNNGSNSVFGILTAIGGGGGGADDVGSPFGSAAPARRQGKSGGSGGGGSNGWPYPAAGTPGQGFPGGSGNWVSGGGGAGGPGGNGAPITNSSAQVSGPGGPGLMFNITGTPTWYAGGGGAGGTPSSGSVNPGVGGIGGGGAGATWTGANGANATAGTASTGGGGGGGAANQNFTSNSGAGGSGVVVIRYGLNASSTLAEGQIRYNTITNSVEQNVGNIWKTTIPNGENILTAGQVLYLDAARYTSGTTWADLSTLGNNATLVNSPTYNSNYGGAITFNGTNQYATISGSTGLTGNAPVSLSAWFYYTGGSTTGSTVIAIGGAGNGGDTFSIFLNNGGAYNISAAFNAGNNVTSANNVYQPNSWNHVVITKSPGNVNATTIIYLNGIELAIASAASITPSFVPNNFVIGTWAQSPGTQNFFTGQIANAAMYTRTLSALEIRQMFAAQSPRFSNVGQLQTSSAYITAGLIINFDAADPASYPPAANYYGAYGYAPNGNQYLTTPSTATNPSQAIWYDTAGGNFLYMNQNQIYNYARGGYFTSSGASAMGATPGNVTISFPNGAGTFEMWVNVNSNASSQGLLSLGPAGGTGPYANFYFAAGSNTVRWEIFNTTSSAYTDYVSTTAVAGAGWTHLIGVWTQSHNAIYINGQFNVGEAQTNYPSTMTGPITLGNYAGNLSGSVAVTRVYNRALSAAEISQNFQSLRGRFGI